MIKKNKSKKVAPSKRLKKYDEGGKEVTGLKKNPLYDAQKMPADAVMDKYEMPTGMRMNQQSEPTKNIPERIVANFPTSDQPTGPLASSSVVSKPSVPKANLLPGGFTSEAQKAAYIKSVKDMMSNGATLDQLVKNKVGTKAGLQGLGFKDSAVKAPVKAPPVKAPTKDKNGKPNLTSDQKAYYKNKYHQDLMDKVIKGVAVKPAELNALHDNLTRKNEFLQKRNGNYTKSALSDIEQRAQRAATNTAVKKGRKQFAEAAGTVALLYATKGRSGGAGPEVIKTGAKKLLGEGVKQSVKTWAQKLLGGSKQLIKSGSKALNPGQKMLGRTINVPGRTVSSGSQKALNSGQKLLNNGQTKLNAGQKALQQGSKISKSTAAKVNQVAKNRSTARVAKNSKIESSIVTNNSVARKMAKQTKIDDLAKAGAKRVKDITKTLKIKKTPLKPGDQTKLDLKRGGGKMTTMRRVGKK